jgi:hypothetical protein
MTWAENEGYHWNVNLLDNPAIFQATNLPEPLFKASQEKIAEFVPKTQAQKKLLHYLCTLEPLNDQSLWMQFCETVSLRDGFRNNSIFDIHPSFKAFWVN